MFELNTDDLPTDLRLLLESGALHSNELLALHRALGITTAADVALELRRRTIADIPDVDPSVERRLAAALPGLRAHEARIPLGRAVALAQPIVDLLRTTLDVQWVEPVGSLRRGHDVVGDIEFVAAAAESSRLFDRLASVADVHHVRLRQPQRIYLVIDRVQIGVRAVNPDIAGAVLLHLTGSAAHVDRLHRMAAERKLSLGPEGLRRLDDGRLVASTEPEIYAALGLPFVAPELRGGGEEIDVALTGQLPRLVSRPDIRGDLHMHTHWSDGRDTIEQMVAQAVLLGYEYVAITDHSTHSTASRTLSADDVERQADEIAAARERFPHITILHGAEVDILRSGHLDFPDRILRKFDIVLASLHDRAGHTPRELLHRYEQAMTHPLVSIVTHPMNRPGPERPGYDVDVDRLFEIAASTGTVLEIDGAPSHLDLESSLARRAARAGVVLSIDSDAHRAEMLERHMNLGLLTARRGWLEPRHVLNTRPIAAVLEFLRAKRDRQGR